VFRVTAEPRAAPPALDAAAVPPAAVDLHSIRVRRGGTEVLHGIDLAIPRGTVAGLLGPSGCGKTTLMRTMVGLQRPSAGRATVLGLVAGSSSLRPRVAYVTQAPSVYGDLTVAENLAYFARLLGAEADVEAALAATGLTRFARQRVSWLSGGERARVSLATALLGEPELLVLDEPTTGLDPVLREELWGTMRGLAERGATLLVSSHVIEEARFCDTLVLMREGRILATGDADSLLRRTGAADVNTAFLRLVEAGPEREERRGEPPAGGEPPERPAWALERPRPRHTLATAARVVRQFRHDPVSVALVLVIPIVLMALMRFVFPGAATFQRIAVPLLGIFPFMALFLVTSVALLRERTSGTLERLMTMPIARVDVIGGYAAAFTAMAAVQLTITAAFGFGVLGMDSASPFWLVALVALEAALAGTALGLLSSTIARTEFQAVLWMSLIVLPQVMLCGLLTPREDMAAVLRVLSAVMPLTYAYDLLDRLGSGASLPSGRAALDAGVLAAGIVVPLWAATLTLRRTSR
jgi:ABC transporter DrrB family efflux protein